MPQDVPLTEGLERIGGMTDIVVVELRLLNQNEAVSCIEAVGITLFERTDSQGKAFLICLRENLSQGGCAQAIALIARLDIQVI